MHIPLSTDSKCIDMHNKHHSLGQCIYSFWILFDYSEQQETVNNDNFHLVVSTDIQFTHIPE